MDQDEFAKMLMAEDRKVWQSPEEIFDQINFPSDPTVVDLGCGPGFFIMSLLKRIGTNGRIYAIDADPVMLRHLDANIRSRSGEVKSDQVVIVEALVTETKLPDHCVDIAFFANLLHDMDDQAAFFDEIKRILKPGGQAIDIDWQKSETNEIGPPIERRLSEGESREIILKNNFRIVYALNAGPYHYGFVCRRKEEN